LVATAAERGAAGALAALGEGAGAGNATRAGVPVAAGDPPATGDTWAAGEPLAVGTGAEGTNMGVGVAAGAGGLVIQASSSRPAAAAPQMPSSLLLEIRLSGCATLSGGR
jgi:hypothetical protein